jgi:hypothetical protein
MLLRLLKTEIQNEADSDIIDACGISFGMHDHSDAAANEESLQEVQNSSRYTDAVDNETIIQASQLTEHQRNVVDRKLQTPRG